MNLNNKIKDKNYTPKPILIYFDLNINEKLSRWLFSTNHKDIGSLYLCFGFLSGLIGLIFIIFYLNLFNLLLLDWTREATEITNEIQNNNKEIQILINNFENKIKTESVNFKNFLDEINIDKIFKFEKYFLDFNSELNDNKFFLGNDNVINLKKNIKKNLIICNNFYLNYCKFFRVLFNLNQINDLKDTSFNFFFNDLFSYKSSVKKFLNKSIEMYITPNFFDFNLNNIKLNTKIENLLLDLEFLNLRLNSKSHYILHSESLLKNVIDDFFNNYDRIRKDIYIDFINLQKINKKDINFFDFFNNYCKNVNKKSICSIKNLKESIMYFEKIHSKINNSIEQIHYLFEKDIVNLYSKIIKQKELIIKFHNLKADYFMFDLKNKTNIEVNIKNEIEKLKNINVNIKNKNEKITNEMLNLVNENLYLVNIKNENENLKKEMLNLVNENINLVNVNNENENLKKEILNLKNENINLVNVNNENENLKKENLILKNENLMLKNENLNLLNEKNILEAEILNNINLEQENNEEIPVNNKFYNFIKDTINFINKGINKGIKIVKSFFTIFI